MTGSKPIRPLFRTRALRFVAAALLPWAWSCSETDCSPSGVSCLADATQSVTAAPQPAPVLNVSPDAFSWSIQEGDAAVLTGRVAVSNVGTGAVSGLALKVDYAGTPTGWLTATLSGTTAPAEVMITAAPEALPPGRHIAEAIVSTPVASNSPLQIRIVVDVTPAPALGPPIIEFHPAGLHFAIPSGTQPPPADLWAVNVGESAPDAFFYSGADIGGVSVRVTIEEGSLMPGDSVRVHVVSSVPTGIPVVQPTFLFFEMKVGDVFKRIITGVSVTLTSPPQLPIAGGTVDGAWGTFIVWDAFESFKPPPPCCPNTVTTVIGAPPGWNDDQPLDLEPHQPKGMGGTLAYTMSDEATPLTGSYEAEVPRFLRVGSFSIDASRRLEAPTIESISLTETEMHVGWTVRPEHRSTIVRIASPSYGFFYEEVVGPGVTKLVVPFDARLGHPHEFEVIGVSADLTDPTLLTTPGLQVHAARALSTATRPTVP